MTSAEYHEHASWYRPAEYYLGIEYPPSKSLARMATYYILALTCKLSRLLDYRKEGSQEVNCCCF